METVEQALDPLPEEVTLTLRQNASPKSWHLSEHHPGSTDQRTPHKVDNHLTDASMHDGSVNPTMTITQCCEYVQHDVHPMIDLVVGMMGLGYVDILKVILQCMAIMPDAVRCCTLGAVRTVLHS